MGAWNREGVGSESRVYSVQERVECVERVTRKHILPYVKYMSVLSRSVVSDALRLHGL